MDQDIGPDVFHEMRDRGGMPVEGQVHLLQERGLVLGIGDELRREIVDEIHHRPYRRAERTCKRRRQGHVFVQVVIQEPNAEEPVVPELDDLDPEPRRDIPFLVAELPGEVNGVPAGPGACADVGDTVLPAGGEQDPVEIHLSVVGTVIEIGIDRCPIVAEFGLPGRRIGAGRVDPPGIYRSRKHVFRQRRSLGEQLCFPAMDRSAGIIGCFFEDHGVEIRAPSSPSPPDRAALFEFRRSRAGEREQ